MKLDETFLSVDEAFRDPELAKVALLADVPGARVARSHDEADLLVKAARKGLDNFYRDRSAYEYFTYLKKVEAVVAQLPRPKFSPPPVSPEDNPSEIWQTAVDYERGANRYYDSVTVTVEAKLRMVEKFGELAVAQAFERPRDALKVYMTLAMLRDAFDKHYSPPTPAELALIAVVHGIDDPMRSPHDPDNSDVRRKRWQYTSSQAKRLFDQELGVSPPPSGPD